MFSTESILIICIPVNRGDFGTDLYYFDKYLDNDEWNSRFHMGISKYHVRATHILHTQLQPIVTFLNINRLTLFKIKPVFGVTLDTQTYMVFQSNNA